MGEEWGKQLAHWGFNVILQGRNRSKLEAVRSSILSAPHPHHAAGDAVDVRLLVCEATVWPNAGLDAGLDEILSDESIRLTVVINNLGTNSGHFPRLDEETQEEMSSVIISNALFPAEVCRRTLPALKRHQPSLLSNVTSIGAWAPPPFVSPYTGTKGFDVSFSRSLYNEMRVDDGASPGGFAPFDVDVCCLAPGQVVSGMHHGPRTLMVPTSAEWTASAIAALKSTWWQPRPPALLIPYRWHYWANVVTSMLPSWVINTIATQVALGLREDYRREQGKNK